jgi:hypothetical protein
MVSPDPGLPGWVEGVFLPEVLCEYRVHAESRTGVQTEAPR